MTSKVTFLVEGNKNMKVKVNNADGTEDLEAQKNIAPNGHDHIFLHGGRTAQISEAPKKRKKKS